MPVSAHHIFFLCPSSRGPRHPRFPPKLSHFSRRAHCFCRAILAALGGRLPTQLSQYRCERLEPVSYLSLLTSQATFPNVLARPPCDRSLTSGISPPAHQGREEAIWALRFDTVAASSPGMLYIIICALQIALLLPCCQVSIPVDRCLGVRETGCIGEPHRPVGGHVCGPARRWDLGNNSCGPGRERKRFHVKAPCGQGASLDCC